MFDVRDVRLTFLQFGALDLHRKTGERAVVALGVPVVLPLFDLGLGTLAESPVEILLVGLAG